MIEITEEEYGSLKRLMGWEEDKVPQYAHMGKVQDMIRRVEAERKSGSYSCAEKLCEWFMDKGPDGFDACLKKTRKDRVESEAERKPKGYLRQQELEWVDKNYDCQVAMIDARLAIARIFDEEIEKLPPGMASRTAVGECLINMKHKICGDQP